MAEASAIFDTNNPCSPISIPSNQTALVIMDYHTFIVPTMPAEGQLAASQTARLREWARSQKMAIVHCLIDVRAQPPAHHKIFSAASQVHQKINTSPNSEVLAGEMSELAARPDEYIFWRPLGQLSCLNSYGIREFLKRHNIRSLVLAGVATSGCVVDTAKAAAEEGFVVSLIQDCCADRNVETHEFVVKKLLSRQCHVADMQDFVDAFSGDA